MNEKTSPNAQTSRGVWPCLLLGVKRGLNDYWYKHLFRPWSQRPCLCRAQASRRLVELPLAYPSNDYLFFWSFCFVFPWFYAIMDLRVSLQLKEVLFYSFIWRLPTFFWSVCSLLYYSGFFFFLIFLSVNGYDNDSFEIRHFLLLSNNNYMQCCIRLWNSNIWKKWTPYNE